MEKIEKKYPALPQKVKVMIYWILSRTDFFSIPNKILFVHIRELETQ